MRARRATLAGAAVLAVLLGGVIASHSFAADPVSAPPLDLANFRPTFTEEFDILDVSPWGPGTRWIAHTPWAGDFGAARFGDPSPTGPFRVVNGILRIELRRDGDTWQGGLLASADAKGAGFLQQYGYFEMRAKMPSGYGVWPAFWLVGRSATDRPEFDIVEYYGRAPDRSMSTYHIWNQTVKAPGSYRATLVPPGSLEADYHTYGIDIGPDQVTYYLDRQPVWQHPTLAAQKQPVMILVNLALEMTWRNNPPPSPAYMYVDYIRAYQRNAAQPGG